MATHELKTWPDYFEAILDGRKRFEFRLNDRDYQVGDELCLREWEPASETYTGRKTYAYVTYLLHVTTLAPRHRASDIATGDRHVIMSIEPRDGSDA